MDLSSEPSTCIHVRARAPLRIGLAGGGTDIQHYYAKHGGATLNTTITKYAYAELIPSPEGFLAKSLDFEKSYYHQSSSTSQEKDLPRELILHLAVYFKIIKKYNDGKSINCELLTYCDSPMGSGLGSSSTLVVAMIKAFTESLNLGIDDYEIAELAYEIERKDCMLAGGKQDQYSATFGGFNFIEFTKNKTIVNPLRIKNWFRCELESSLLLHFTGISRHSADVINEQSESIISSNSKTIEFLDGLKRESIKMKEALLKSDREGFKNSLNTSWRLKSNTSTKISNSLIEDRIKFAFKNGAEAAKVSGAGGGGFILFFCKPSQTIRLRNRLQEYNEKSFFCSFGDHGAEAWRIN